MGSLHATGMLLIGLAVSSGGCCKSRLEEGPGKTAEGDACEALLDDGFGGSLDGHWKRGTNTKHNAKGPGVTTDQGQLVFSQRYDFVETKESFSGDFEVELLGISRKAGSNQCADLFVELVAAPEQVGMFRFSYGLDKKESINIGKGPVLGKSRGWSCIRDAPQLKEVDARGESKGRLRFERRGQRVRLSYTDSTNQTISTSWVSVPAFEATKVRIWGLGGKGATRFIDRVRICAKGRKPKGASEASGRGESEKRAGKGSPSGAEPMPLKKGNRWVYRFRSAGLNGTFSYVAGPVERLRDVEVVRMKYTDTSGLYGDGYWQLLASRGSRLHFHGDSVRGTHAQPDLWVDSNSKVGDSWKTNVGGSITWKLVSRSEVVTVPAGTFKQCFHVQGTNPASGKTTDHWWALGVGDVKMRQPAGPTMMTFELVSYDFG